MICVVVDSFSSWRKTSRKLLSRGVPPSDITWTSSDQTAFDFSDDTSLLALPVIHKTLNVPVEFIRLAKDVACFRDHEKWPLLYSIAWRLMFEDRDILKFKIDAQVKRLFDMYKAIGRDRHKMEAFVRFKRIDCPPVNADDTGSISSAGEALEDAEQYVAWFEPDHLIVESVMPFFTGRFKNMRWSILTKDICAHWDMHELTYSPGMPKTVLGKDSIEELWLEYYANIFNPARLKLNAMQSEMPKKYWANLPEAPLIPELTRKAHQSMTQMIEAPSTERWEKTARSRFVSEAQKHLRTKSSLAVDKP